MLWSGCSLRPLQQQHIGQLGRFEFQDSDNGFEGIVVGVPHGHSEPDAVDYANSIRDGLGAGLVIAYDFNHNRIPVEQPRVYNTPITWTAADPARPGTVYPEFRKLLQAEAGGTLRFYVGVRVAPSVDEHQPIEIATSGLPFEQLKALKESFNRIRDRSISDTRLSKIDIALNPLDDISWNAYGVKNHGVLMFADKGLIVRLPKILASPPYKTVYGDILKKWVKEALLRTASRSSQFPEIQVSRLRYGRIESIPPRDHRRGIVIGAPHGSFDWYTGELVEELTYRTSLPGVVTRGFTPTECGGWRINVNRPTEQRYPTDTVERNTERAKEVFQRFTESVFRSARGPLELYIDIHQNGSERDIDVATVGITRKRALAIKKAYREIRDRVLGEAPDVTRVKLIIEPVDQVAIGAWAAKDYGILRMAKSSLHFELPAGELFFKAKARHLYTVILAELITRITTLPGDRAALPSSVSAESHNTFQ
jgi:hypothetical protein